MRRRTPQDLERLSEDLTRWQYEHPVLYHLIIVAFGAVFFVALYLLGLGVDR